MAFLPQSSGFSAMKKRLTNILITHQSWLYHPSQTQTNEPAQVLEYMKSKSYQSVYTTHAPTRRHSPVFVSVYELW